MQEFKSSTWKGKRITAAASASLAGDAYTQLIGLLLSALLASVLMALTFAGIATLIWLQTHDVLLGGLGLAGVAASTARSAFLAVFRLRYPTGITVAAAARRWERCYGGLSFSFAAVVGCFCAATLRVGPPVTHLLATGLLFGYCSGAVARIGIRSWIAIPCLVLAALPMVLVAALHSEVEYRAFAGFLLVFLGGGIESARYVARNAATQIAMQREFASLARQDDLTGLANRLALRAHFEAIAQEKDAFDRVAIHCLDLDRFKPVNDRYGHPIGDALLRAVADRLNRLVRTGNLAVRSGGDEFVVLQADVEHADQAHMLALRIQRDLGAAYIIDGQQIFVGCSVGYSLAGGDDCSLEGLIACADRALYEAKRLGGGGVRCGSLSPETPVRIAS